MKNNAETRNVDTKKIAKVAEHHEYDSDSSSEHSEDYSSHKIRQITTKACGIYKISVQLNDISTRMEYDTAADRSIINEEIWQKLNKPQLRQMKHLLQNYDGTRIEIMGKTRVTVKVGSAKCTHNLVVVKNNDVVFGKDLMRKLNVEPKIKAVEWQPKNQKSTNQRKVTKENKQLQKLLDEYSDLFDERIGTVKNFVAKIRLTPEAKPKVCRPCPVPFAIRQGADLEID